MGIEPLIELCDLIAQKPDQFADKLTWMCGRCLQPESLLAGSPRVSRAQLNAVVALARFLSKCPNHTYQRPEYVVSEFLRSIPASFNQSFWPQSFGTDSIASFYADFLAYVSKATELSSDFAADVAEFMGDIAMSAVGNETGDLRISRAFLRALSQSFLPILISDGDKLVAYLLDHFVSDVPNSFQSSPIIASPQNHVSGSSSSSASRESAMNGYSVAWKSSVDQLVTSIGSVGFNDGGGNAAGYKQLVVTFEGEPVERLEKQEIAFKLIAHILDKVFIDTKLLDQVMIIAKEQLQSMSAFLKIRKNDWNEQGTVLKARIDTKLSVFQAAARLKIKSLASLNCDGKSSKKLLLSTLALLVDNAEACLFSVWRKLRTCEELFSSLLSGITQIAITRGGQLLGVLLIRLKPLVLATCAQADTWGNSQGAMFESVLKTSCEIIEFGWSKDRSPVDSFIMGLATSIRERSDYEEEIFSHVRNEEDMNNAEEIKKRKNSHDFLGKLSGLEVEDKDLLTLSSSALDTCHHHRHYYNHRHHYHRHHNKHSHNGPHHHHPHGHSNYPPHTLSTPSRHLYHPHHHHLHLRYHSAPPRGRPWPVS